MLTKKSISKILKQNFCEIKTEGGRRRKTFLKGRSGSIVGEKDVLFQLK